MVLACVNAFLGLLLTIGIGTQVLDLALTDSLRDVLASNVAGLISLLLVLKGQATPWVRRRILTRSLVTWVFLVGIYFSLLLAFAPALRDPQIFIWLVLPLILSLGFIIMLFGPLQDRMVARRQRQELLKGKD